MEIVKKPDAERSDKVSANGELYADARRGRYVFW